MVSKFTNCQIKSQLLHLKPKVIFGHLGGLKNSCINMKAFFGSDL